METDNFCGINGQPVHPIIIIYLNKLTLLHERYMYIGSYIIYIACKYNNIIYIIYMKRYLLLKSIDLHGCS